MHRGVFANVLFALVAAGCACPGGEAVAVLAPAGEVALEVCAEIARSEADRRAGLRGHAPLAPGEGLLIVFPVEDEICIVNDGVSFPIDVLYASEAGAVVAIERAVAAGDPTPRCHAPVQRVLEVAAGQLEGIALGHTLR